MTPDDVVDVLTKCAAYDSRTVGEADVMAWHEILGRVDRGDALEAVRVHYAESSNRAMPADIRKLAAGIRDAREGRERQHERRLAIEAGPTTRDRSAEVAALVQAVSDALPKPDAHARALDRARRENGRPGPLPARERRKPKKKPDHPIPADDQIAALATRYLLDGYAPEEVATKLFVSRRWCEKTIRRLKPERVEGL